MRNSSLSALLLATLTVFSAALRASAQLPQSVTVSMRPYKGARAIVAIKINGAGPYDFLVDTGATATVVDAALFQELNLKATGTLSVHSVAGTDTQTTATADEISLEGLAVHNIRLLRTEKLPLPAEDRGVRGVLGENFLEHFDLLIDNQHRRLTLDTGSTLSTTLGGERLPINFPSDPSESEVKYQPLVTVTVPEFASHPLTVLLDSGADKFLLMGARRTVARPSNGGVEIRTVNGSMACRLEANYLHWGKTSLGDVEMVMCQSPIETGRDYAGTLPTNLFRQVFLSHSGAYVIVNPSTHAPAAQEVAVVAPLLR